MNEKEARTWATLEKCLNAGCLYHTVKNSEGGLVDIPPSEDKVKTLRAILNDVNRRALSKDRYDAMSIFHSLFFSDEAASIIAMIDRYEHFDRRARKSERGIKERNARGALTEIMKLDSDIYDDGLADIQAKLPGIIDGYFKQNPKHEKVDRKIKASIKETIYCGSKDNIDKNRYVHAAHYLKTIGYPHHFKLLSDLSGLIPPFEFITNKALGARVRRHMPA